MQNTPKDGIQLFAPSSKSRQRIAKTAPDSGVLSPCICATVTTAAQCLLRPSHTRSRRTFLLSRKHTELFVSVARGCWLRSTLLLDAVLCPLQAGRKCCRGPSCVCAADGLLQDLFCSMAERVGIPRAGPADISMAPPSGRV